nr:hypothetical protein GCM10020185_77330 [Pseudomonas brassicacearum subsp. brassicacearum]
MNLSRLFILRPVATTLSMLAIILAGLIAYRLLPVSALPQVDYPTIRVMTLYPGASPDVMTSAVTAPLERQFGQMPGLTQMASTSSGGASVITLRFNLDINMDVAEQQVQAAINAATNLLPKDLPAPPVYNKVNPADTPVLTLAITSKTMLLPKLNDLVDTRMAQKNRPDQRRRHGHHRRWPAPGRANQGQSRGPGGQRPEPGGCAHIDRRLQRQPAQGQLRRPDPGLDARRQRPVDLAQGLRRTDPGLRQRCAVAAQGRRADRRWRRKTNALPPGPTKTRPCC